MGLLLAGLWMQKHAPDFFWYGMALLTTSVIVSFVYGYKAWKEEGVLGPAPLRAKITIGYGAMMLFILGPG